MIGAVTVFFLYICYIIYIGDDIPMTKEDLKKRVNEDFELLQKETKKNIMGK